MTQELPSSRTRGPSRAVDIRPVSPDTWPAVAELFASGGDPRWCWCQYWRKPGSNWSNTTADDNRADLRALVGAGDPAPGLVALDAGKAVGWVGLGPRAAFGRLARSRTIPQLPGDGVWVVNCFVVGRTARRSGIASALLVAAVDYAFAHGAATIEGYPVATAGNRITSASCTRARSACSSGPASRSWRTRRRSRHPA